MMDVPELDTDVRFGEVDEGSLDWRAELAEEEDPDDDEIETPDDVAAMLGFDPTEGD